MPQTGLRQHTIAGSDKVSIAVAATADEILFSYRPPGPFEHAQNVFLALGTERETGAAVLPFAPGAEGSTVFLPFQANLLFSTEIRGSQISSFLRKWEGHRWQERESTRALDVIELNGEIQFRIPRTVAGNASVIDFVVYAKDPNANHGWGWFWGCSDRTVDAGLGDKYIPRHHELRLESERIGLVTLRRRHDAGETRTRIYQLFVRLFGNTNETRKQNGTLAENGVGWFADINEAAISSIQEMGFTHIWLTGVLQQATATDYSEAGQPADDSDLLKGLAGSRAGTSESPAGIRSVARSAACARSESDHRSGSESRGPEL